MKSRGASVVPSGSLVGLYVPAFTQTSCPLLAAAMASCKFWKAQAHDLPLPPGAAAPSTYQVVPLLGAATVKVAWQVWVDWQVEFNVKVTVVEPPQAGGAPVLLFVKTAPQPPVKLASNNHSPNAASIAAWVWPAGVVTLLGQVKVATGPTCQVNVRVQVLVSPQSPVAT